MKLGLFGGAALALPAERLARTQVALSNRIAASELPQPFTIPFKTPPVLRPDRQTLHHDYYTLTQSVGQAEILPGRLTEIWGYNGMAPGPTIVASKGRPTVVQHVNNLPDVHPTMRYNVWTSTHLHGSASLPQFDGYASDITDTASWKDYEYPNVQEARTLWYHDHGVHITAPNAYMGLAAMYILHDEHELSQPIPHGRYDVPLILRDAMFEDNGALLYDDNDQSGVYGDVNLVNGVPWPVMRVERRKYRFRILNAALSRSYGLQLDNGRPLTVIGTDGGLMPHPAQTARLLVGMAERYEIVIDFADYAIGERIVIENDSPKNNIDYETTGVVMAFDVVSEATDLTNNEIPYDLNVAEPTMLLTEADAVRTRQMSFDRSGGQWTINDTTWDDVVNSDYQLILANPAPHDIEIWELQNPHGGWFHPVHIHLVDFRILDRNGQPPYDFEQGPKDVAYVAENETVRVIMKFEYQTGRYMMHCHNLVHEDHDMMAQFLVGDDGVDRDPIESGRPSRKPARPVRDRRDDPEEVENDDDDGGGGGGGNGGGGGGGGGGDDNRGPGGGGGSGSGGGGSAGSDLASGSSVTDACTPAKKAIVKKKAVVKKKKAVVKKKPKRTLAKKTTVKAKQRAVQAQASATCPTPKPKTVLKPKRKAVAKPKRKPVTKRKPVKAKRR